MGFFTSQKLETLRDLFVSQLQDLYDAEHRLTDALPKMADAAHARTLKSAFESHLRETQTHITRLEQVFTLVAEEPKRETCEAIKGLIAEGDEVVGAEGDRAVIDAALIAAAQRVEHYEMAGYGVVRTLATQLGQREAADLLQQTLNEEGNADKKLTEIAEAFANEAAARA